MPEKGVTDASLISQMKAIEDENRQLKRMYADLLAVVREFLNPDVSRSGLDRCLRRHGVGNLRDLQAKAPPTEAQGVQGL